MNDLEFIKKYANKKTTLLGSDFPNFMQLSYGTIEEIKSLITQEKLLECFVHIYNDTLKNNILKTNIEQIKKVDKKELGSFYIHFLEQLELIGKSEQVIEETSDFDMTLIRSGVKKLDKYKYINTLDTLSKGDKTKYDYFLNKPYAVVRTLLAFDNDKTEIQRKYQELKSKEK